MAKVLLVEDDESQALVVCDFLSSKKHVVDVVHLGEEGLYQARFYQYQLLIVDWELPDISGLELIKRYRQDGGTAPILFLTGRTDIGDKVDGLETGADDYLTKPFDYRALLAARTEALLRRGTSKYDGNRLTVGALELDVSAKKAFIRDVEVVLLPKEYAVLEFLMKNPDRSFSTEQLLNSVWSSESDATEVVVRSTISRLRKRLEVDGGMCIENVRGFGYRLRSKID